MNLSYYIVILNVVKNLKSISLCMQILRDAQDDNLIGKFHFDTLSKWIWWQQKRRWQDSCHPLSSVIQRITCPVARVAGVSAKT